MLFVRLAVLHHLINKLAWTWILSSHHFLPVLVAEEEEEQSSLWFAWLIDVKHGGFQA